MTIHQTINGRAGEGLDASACRTPNKGSPEAVTHAYVENGQLFIMEGGRYRTHSRVSAWSLWFDCFNSPYADTQERARQIRAAMDEAYPQDIAA